MWLPVGEMPAHSPRWVPRAVQRYATLSPSANMSSISAPQFGEGAAVRSDQPLQAVASGGLVAGKACVLHVTGGHERIHGCRVALDPRFLEEPEDEGFVFFRGHSHAFPANPFICHA